MRIVILPNIADINVTIHNIARISPLFNGALLRFVGYVALVSTIRTIFVNRDNVSLPGAKYSFSTDR